MEDKLLSALLPFFPFRMQRRLILLVKLWELASLLQLYRQPEPAFGPEPPPPPFTWESFLESFQKQLPPEQQEQFQSLRQMLQLFQTVQELQKGPDDPEQVLRGMLSPEQQAMFESFSAMFSEEEVSL